jgi:hypothetical protein
MSRVFRLAGVLPRDPAVAAWELITAAHTDVLARI